MLDEHMKDNVSKCTPWLRKTSSWLGHFRVQTAETDAWAMYGRP